MHYQEIWMKWPDEWGGVLYTTCAMMSSRLLVEVLLKLIRPRDLLLTFLNTLLLMVMQLLCSLLLLLLLAWLLGMMNLHASWLSLADTLLSLSSSWLLLLLLCLLLSRLLLLLRNYWPADKYLSSWVNNNLL